MPNNIKKIYSGMNVSGLCAAIKRQPELWNLRKLRAEHPQSPHRDVHDIWLRYNDWKNYQNEDVSTFNKEHDSVWYPEFRALPQARSLIFRVMNLVDAERLGGVLITKIPAGKQCFPHVDGGWHAGYYDKYAVQLDSHPGQAFCYEGESLDAAPGDVYWFRNDVKHWVVNPTDFDRMTMIICIRSDRPMKE